MNIFSKSEKRFLILGTIIILLLPEVANFNNKRTGSFDRNVEFLERECLQAIAYKSQTIYWDKESPDCEERAKWLANSWSDLLVPVIGLIIFWWWFLGLIILAILRMIPFFASLVKKSDRYSFNLEGSVPLKANVKPQNGEEFQFRSSFNVLKNFKTNPTPQMYTDLTVAINLYIKKYPKFTSIVSVPAFKNYINWAIQETDNVFKDKPQKSKIQKESLIKLLEKLNRKL